jgi:hypothetical protein
MAVGDIEVINHLHVFHVHAAPDGLDRLLHARIVGHGEKLGGHDATGRVRVVLEQVLQLVLTILGQGRGHLGTQFLVQFADEIDQIIRRQVIQNRGQPSQVRLAHDIRKHPR